MSGQIVLIWYNLSGQIVLVWYNLSRQIVPYAKRARVATFRVLRLTSDGVSALRSCREPSSRFHFHPDSLFYDVNKLDKGSVKFSRSINLEVLDFRGEA